ncbi:HK97 gp10 family phage protein [Pseudoclavibacter helvolus]|uniref:HK97 gp10 family phage protein n=1 Tax=Pseudoclavibacter helvolus TaxID=255205 RepID=A0A7W4YFF5_9MICO|nr:HK97 gp10 family phage protein [Pseudoclavibacter helvolus]MBB2956971.1 hypothetical protein [Pseudoclavibacter helvolus]
MADFNDDYIRSLAKSPEVVALVKSGADEVEGNAKTLAPVDTGDYRDSIHVVRDDMSDRVRFLVVSDDEAAMIIESQSGTLSQAVTRSSGG